MPEVALVAILDADKEGFLRSDVRSSKPLVVQHEIFVESYFICR